MQSGLMTVTQSFAPARPWLFLIGFAILLFGSAGGARAQSCTDDLGALAEAQQQIQALNQISQANKGKLDPVAACPRFRTLSAIEGQMVAYLTKNKEWCNIPDEFLNNFKTGSARTSDMANKACEIAAKVKKMQKEQALGGGGPAANMPPPPKLPAGPL